METKRLAEMINYTKKYGQQLRKLPISDWKVIAQFNRIIKNYLKIIKAKSADNKSKSA